MGLLMPFACAAYLFVVENRKFHVIKTNVKGLKRDEDVEIFVGVVMELVERGEMDTSRLKLEGMLRNYLKNSQGEGADAAVLGDLAKENRAEEAGEKTAAWYRLLKSIVEQSLKKFSKSPRLRLLMAYILHQKLKNKFKSLFELMQASEIKPNYQEEFAIYRYSLIIEEEMMEVDLRANNEVGSMDVNQMVQFQNLFVDFLTTLDRAVRLHLDFWRELTEENPDIKKLESLGSGITKIVEESRSKFSQLNEINSLHQRCLGVYGRFLKEVVNDEITGQKILDRGEKIQRQAHLRQADENMSKLDENSDTAIITISGNFRQIGIITNSNSHINQLLGYNKLDIVGEKIETIMPKIFADSHDDLLLKYFENPDRQLNIERTVYPMNLKGYIVPCALLAKILPNLENGIQIVGFLRKYPGFEIKKDKFVLYSSESGIIFGVTKACYESFGLRASLTYGRCYNMSELNFDLLCPELLDESKMQDLKSPAGFEVTLDTTSIQVNHPLENDDDASIEEGQIVEKEEDEVRIGEGRIKKYQKYQVKARIIEDNRWFEGKLRVTVLKILQAFTDEDSVEGESAEIKGNANEQRQIKKTDALEEKREQQGGQPPMAEESLNAGDISQHSNEGGNTDLKTVKDARAMIAEKNVPKSIKNLNRIFYAVISMLVVLTGVLVYFFVNNCAVLKDAGTAIKVAHIRHSLLSEIYFHVRKYEFLAVGVLNYSDTISTENEIKAKLKDLGNKLQQNQFSVVEAVNCMKKNLGREVSISEITTYTVTALSADPSNIKVDQSTSTYESALFQFISETFRIQNASFQDVQDTYQEANKSEITKNLLKSFEGVYLNGLRFLRRGSIQVAIEIVAFYKEDIGRGFYLETMLVCFIGMLMILLGTFLLVPTVFKVMRTTKLVLALFGMISKNDVGYMCGKCAKFGDEMLSENGGHKFSEDLKEKAFKTKQKLVNHIDEDKEEGDKLIEVDHHLEIEVSPRDEGHMEDEEHIAIDNKTEKPSSLLLS